MKIKSIQSFALWAFFYQCCEMVQSSPLKVDFHDDRMDVLLLETFGQSIMDHSDPLVHTRSVSKTSLSMSMGYYSYTTHRPTTKPVTTTHPTSPPSSRPLSTKPTMNSISRTKAPSLIHIPPSNFTNNASSTNSTAGLQGNGSTASKKTKVNLIPYIISATVASVVGFLSVTALIISRRRRIEPILFSDELEDDSMLDTVSYA